MKTNELQYEQTNANESHTQNFVENIEAKINKCIVEMFDVRNTINALAKEIDTPCDKRY